MAPKCILHFTHIRNMCNMRDVLARAVCPSQNDSLQTPPQLKEIRANYDHDGSKIISKVGHVGQA